jgi:hypothetical protein
MSSNYRDELDAQLAANEALKSEKQELAAQLAQAQHTIGQQQQMLQAQGISAPNANQSNKSVVLIVGAVVGVLVAMCAAGALLFTTRATVASMPAQEGSARGGPSENILVPPDPRVAPEGVSAVPAVPPSTAPVVPQVAPVSGSGH